MRKKALPMAAVVLLIAACKNGTGGSATPQRYCEAKPQGTLLQADSIRSRADALNDFDLVVKLISGDGKGQYMVKAAVGPNEAESPLTMPRGGESLCPVLEREGGNEAYIIGFHSADASDTTFYPYFRVAAQKGAIEMAYVKAYSFE